MAALSEQEANRLTGELVNHLKRTGSIRRTGIIAQIEIIVFRHQLMDLIKDGQAPITGIENTNGAWSLREKSHELIDINKGTCPSKDTSLNPIYSP